MMEHKISIIGMGYVGLCTAVFFSIKGYKTITTELDPKKVELINRGIPPFYEPDLKEYLQKVVKNGFLKCIINNRDAILDTDITFITVGTPRNPDGSINLQYIEDVAHEIGEALRDKETYHLVVVRSTIIPGTTENMIIPIIEKYSRKVCGKDFGLCMNPEFLREGSALDDVFHPDRIVIGEYDLESGDMLDGLYRELYSDDVPPFFRTNIPTSEIIKYANNAFLATKISFINELANICERISKADITIVAKALGFDSRIAPSFLNAGLGYGGSCLPKDVEALIAFSKNSGYDPTLLQAVEKVNNTQPYRAVELARNLLGELVNKRIAVLGLAFKPNTDDIREAVSTKLINRLLSEGAKIVAYDPAAIKNARGIFGDWIDYAPSMIDCIQNAECCIISTEWDEFKKMKPEDFLKHMKNPIIIDGRRIYDPNSFSKKMKFAAIGLGPNPIR